MLRLNRLLKDSTGVTRAILSNQRIIQHGAQLSPAVPRPSQTGSVRFLDIYQMGNKEAIEKERARLKDEMSRGYFADMSDLKKHGGKIAVASKTIVPAAVAVKFPALEVSFSDGRSNKLPLGMDEKVAGDAHKLDVPKLTLLCLSFRASSQAMVESWSRPFQSTFKNSENIQLYEVSFVDSWLLSRGPIKRLLLRVMKKSNAADAKDDALQRQVAYSFGDHYYFRKELKILNLLTGYIFLVDKFGRIRWQGSGTATEEEVQSLISCTSLLLEEK